MYFASVNIWQTLKLPYISEVLLAGDGPMSLPSTAVKAHTVL